MIEEKDKEIAQKEWAEVLQKIYQRAEKSKRKPLNFEVYHESEVARIAFLQKYLEGGTMVECKCAALDRVKIKYIRNISGRFLRYIE